MNNNSSDRRRFISKTLKGASVAVLAPGLLTRGYPSPSGTSTIDSIELFRYDINTPRHFSWGVWHNRQHVFMKMTSGGHVGWAEVAASKNNPELSLEKWSAFLEDFLHLSLDEAYERVKASQYGDGKQSPYSKKNMEFMEMALLDLQGRIAGKPSIELLGMAGRSPVPGLYCVLDSDLEKVEKAIVSCKAQHLDDYVKFKLYGDRDRDRSIIKLGREMLGEDAYILSDANRGYKGWESIDELADLLNELQALGLNAIEDPAELSNEQWIGLQEKVQPLSLIPDYVTRPAWKGIERIAKGMGDIYNFHPESMGSLHHLVPLAKKVNGFGGKIMIGDASLVGPACTVWQQIAIGLGAEWVEALEKQEDSEDYLSCVISKATYRNDAGRFAYSPKAGFGLELDEGRLRKVCSQNLTI